MTKNKKVKFGRLALVVFVGIQLGLVGTLFIRDFDATDEVIEPDQLYWLMGILGVIYVLYLKLATQNIGDVLHKEKEKLHRIIECIPNSTLLLNTEGDITFFNTRAASELNLDLTTHTLAKATDVFECPAPNPFQKNFSGHATGFCHPLGDNVDIIVDSHSSAEGHEKIILIKPIDNVVAPSTNSAASALSFTHLIKSLEEDEPSNNVLLYCLNAERMQWQSDILSGTLQDVAGECLLTTCIDNALKPFQKLIDRCGVSIDKDIDSSAKAPLNQEAMENILKEIIANALAHCQEGSKISFKAQLDDDAVKLQITDTGKGLATSSISTIWDENYVGDNQTGLLKKSAGLGLPALKKCLSLVDRDAFIEGAEGKGCRVTLRL